MGLRDRKYDLILARLVQPTLADDDDLNIEVLFSDRLLVVAGTHSQWTRRRKVDLARIADEPWVAWEHRNHGFTGILPQAFRAAGLDMPKVALVTQSVPLRLHLLANGPYITAFARSTLGLYADRYGLKALPVGLPK